jgi:hypothetical protein
MEEKINKYSLSEKLQSKATIWVIFLVLTGLLGSLKILDGIVLPNSGSVLNYSVDTCKVDKDSLCFYLNSDTNMAAKQTAAIFPDAPKPKIPIGKFTYNLNPKLMIWGLLISMMVATALGLLLPSSYHIIKLIENFSLGWKTIIKNVIFIIIIGSMATILSGAQGEDKILSPFDVIRDFHIVLSDTCYLNLLIYFTTGLACIHLLGMIIINSCIEKGNWGNSEGEELLKKFQQLNGSMKFFLSCISVLIVYSIVTTSLLQQSINNALVINNHKFIIFPSEFIYAYGLIFTIFLSIVYIPVYQNLRIKGQLLAEKSAPAEGTNVLKDKLKQFDLAESPLKNLQVILSILAPILGSVFLDFIKGI